MRGGFILTISLSQVAGGGAVRMEVFGEGIHSAVQHESARFSVLLLDASSNNVTVRLSNGIMTQQ